MRSHEKSSSLSGSVASSMSSLHGVCDFSDLKEVVKDLAKRLEILEKVFLFVDFEQIRELVDKFAQLDLAPTAKAGIDRALDSTSQDSSLAEQKTTEERPKAGKKSKPKSSAQAPVAAKMSEQDEGADSSQGQEVAVSPLSMSSAKASETTQQLAQSPGSRLQPLKRSHLAGPLRTTHLTAPSASPAESSASLLQAPKHFHACVGEARDDEEDEEPRSTKVSEDTKGRIQFGLGLTASTVASTDAGDPTSTCSSWSQAGLTFANDPGALSVRGDLDILDGRAAGDSLLGGDSENIDSERLSNFMKQATRPRFRRQFQGYK